MLQKAIAYNNFLFFTEYTFDLTLKNTFLNIILAEKEKKEKEVNCREKINVLIRE